MKKGLTQRRQRAQRGFDKPRASFVRQSIHDSLNAVLQMDLSKVEQQAKLAIAESELCQDLLPMNAHELFHGFQFNDDFVLDQQIGPKTFLEDQVVVTNWDRHLPLHLEPLLSQFMREGNLVNRFEKPRPGLGMNLECRVEDEFGEFVFIHRSQANTMKCLTQRAQRTQRALRMSRRSIHSSGNGCKTRKHHSSWSTFASFAPFA